MSLDKYEVIFPMIYLLISIAAAVLFHYVGVPEVVGGIIIGAAITRVKVPTKKF